MNYFHYKKKWIIFQLGIGYNDFIVTFDSTNTLNVFTMMIQNVEINENENPLIKESEISKLKDGPSLTVDGLKKWLVDFRDTNYPNRYITNEFWTVLKHTVQFGVNVTELLGNEILDHLRKIDKNRLNEIVK